MIRQAANREGSQDPFLITTLPIAIPTYLHTYLGILEYAPTQVSRSWPWP